MIKVQATLNSKQKKTLELDVESREDLAKKIEEAFNVEPASIRFIKPPLKVIDKLFQDEDQFKKNIKDGIAILFLGAEKKELNEQEKKKLEEKKKKEEEAFKKAQLQAQQLKKNDHERALEKLNKDGFKQRGFSYLNEYGVIEKLNTDHYTSPVHLMRIVPEFRKYCICYKVQPKNPDGLLISQLGSNFKMIDGDNGGKLVDPLDWCSSFIAYCADDIEYPYPTYDFNYIISKIFLTIQNAHVTESERRQPNATPNLLGPGNNLFAIETNIKKTKLTKFDEDDFEAGKQMDKKQFRYILQCDLSDPNIKSIEEGIRKRFEQKIVWQNFYAFDLEYKQKIVSIERPAKYLFVHTNRIGYPPAKDQNQEIVLLPNEKSTHKIRTKRILDLSDMCSSQLKERLHNGQFERQKLFYKLAQQDLYENFIQKLKSENANKPQNQRINIEAQYTDNELKYMYFDEKLFSHDIFHEYYFDQLKGSKQTGQYRLIGVIFHKGKYYHHPDPTHKVETHGHTKQECRGEFMVMVYKQGNEWLKFYDAQIQKVDLNEALHEKYWGGGEWTPALCIYKEIYIKDIQIEIPDN